MTTVVNMPFWHIADPSGSITSRTVARMKSLHDQIYERFIASLKDARTDAGVTQADLASRLGTDQSYVSKYERCERRLDYIEVRSICLALKLHPAKFIKTFEDSVEDEGGGK